MGITKADPPNSNRLPREIDNESLQEDFSEATNADAKPPAHNGNAPDTNPNAKGAASRASDANVLEEGKGKVVSMEVDANGVKEVEKKKKKKEAPGGSVSIFKLFAFADPLDYLLMFVGTVGAAVHGLALPIAFLFFGKLLNGFGANVANPDKTSSVVGQVGSTSCSSSSRSYVSCKIHVQALVHA